MRGVGVNDEIGSGRQSSYSLSGRLPYNTSTLKCGKEDETRFFGQ